MPVRKLEMTLIEFNVALRMNAKQAHATKLSQTWLRPPCDGAAKKIGRTEPTRAIAKFSDYIHLRAYKQAINIITLDCIAGALHAHANATTATIALAVDGLLFKAAVRPPPSRAAVRVLIIEKHEQIIENWVSNALHNCMATR